MGISPLVPPERHHQRRLWPIHAVQGVVGQRHRQVVARDDHQLDFGDHVHNDLSAAPQCGGEPALPVRDPLLAFGQNLENQITKDNAPRIRAKIVVEGANGPTTPDAHRHLHDRGVFVVPDILANGGGVTTSYFEWVQDRHGYLWTEKEVNERLEAKMCEAYNAVLQTAMRYKVDMRTAAYVVAINRVATVTRLRGMYA